VTYFEYVAVYFGIIVGLALANILGSFHKLIEARSRVRWGWLAPISAFFAATLTLGEFWSLWIRQHEAGNLTFLTWLPEAVDFSLLYMMCAASLPDEAGDGVDLKRYYIENRDRFWGFATALYALNLCTWGVDFWQHGFGTHYVHDHLRPIYGNAFLVTLSLSLVFVRATWWHVVAFALMWLYLLFYFGPMHLG
jgi:hypothetical protein